MQLLSERRISLELDPPLHEAGDEILFPAGYAQEIVERAADDAVRIARSIGDFDASIIDLDSPVAYIGDGEEVPTSDAFEPRIERDGLQTRKQIVGLLGIHEGALMQRMCPEMAPASTAREREHVDEKCARYARDSRGSTFWRRQNAHTARQSTRADANARRYARHLTRRCSRS